MKDCESCGAPREVFRYACSYCTRTYTGALPRPDTDALRYKVTERYETGWTDNRKLFDSTTPPRIAV